MSTMLSRRTDTHLAAHPAAPLRGFLSHHPNNGHCEEGWPGNLWARLEAAPKQPTNSVADLRPKIAALRGIFVPETSTGRFDGQFRGPSVQDRYPPGDLYLSNVHWTFDCGSPPVSRTGKNGGGERDRTDDPLLAKQVLSQLSYAPNPWEPPSTQPTVSDNNREREVYSVSLRLASAALPQSPRGFLPPSL